MEGHIEKQPTFTIEAPTLGDEVALAPMHLQAWKETYVTPESGLTAEKVDELLQHMLTNTDFRKNTITEALANPDRVHYRVVKNAAGDIVGFIHGSKHETTNELDGLYLLNEVKGVGVGGALMAEFLTWIDAYKPTHLEVFAFNHHAIGFYAKYGFAETDAPVQLWKELLPFIQMVRPADKSE